MANRLAVPMSALERPLDAKHERCRAEWQASRPGPWWFRCSHPERPGDNWAVYLWSCDGCTVGLVADVQVEPHAAATTHEKDDEGRSCSLADVLDDCTRYRDSEDLRPIGAR